MKKLIPAVVCLVFFSMAVVGQTATTTTPAFNPTIKFKGLIQPRYEVSGTDSVDVQGHVSDDPLKSNFRLRRVELRADITLNNRWSGVIRVQLPELKTTTPTTGRVLELAYVDYRYADQLSIRAGQFKVPFELDDLTSHEDLRMIDRGTTDRIFMNNFLDSYQPGVMVFGTFLKKTTPLNYYAAVVNGSDRSLNFDTNSGKNVVGRIEFYPVSSLRLAVNGQIAGVTKDVMGNAEGADVSWQPKLTEKLNLILEGEYIEGTNLLTYGNSPDSTKDVKNFRMTGYFGQALLRINVNVPGLRTFEFGGKYENTDPLKTNTTDDYSTITGTVGFIFLPDNDVRLQLNVIHTNYEQEEPGVQKNNNMFVAQLQLKI